MAGTLKKMIIGLENPFFYVYVASILYLEGKNNHP